MSIYFDIGPAWAPTTASASYASFANDCRPGAVIPRGDPGPPTPEERLGRLAQEYLRADPLDSSSTLAFLLAVGDL